ncbi:NAD(P)-dependent oxidoreductase, partial [Neisseria gonorrhoeae]
MINCGRGGPVDENALPAALKYGQIGGAGGGGFAPKTPEGRPPLADCRVT